MRERPPWSYARVVKSCLALSPTDKLIWLEHRDLVNGRHGCTASASAIGRRLGVSRKTVERIRQGLLCVGLLVKHDRGSGRTAAWRPQLPATCRPQGVRITDDDAERYAETLAEHIRQRGGTSDTRVRGPIAPTSDIGGGGWTCI